MNVTVTVRERGQSEVEFQATWDSFTFAEAQDVAWRAVMYLHKQTGARYDLLLEVDSGWFETSIIPSPFDEVCGTGRCEHVAKALVAA